MALPLNPKTDLCDDCGTSLVERSAEASRCPACFDNYLYGLDNGFLESYRKFGCRSRLVVAEACLRALVLESPDHRKVLAMTIFEQYVQAMSDLAGLFLAFRDRRQSPILKSFMEFRLDAASAVDFFGAIEAVTDEGLCRLLNLPLPIEVAGVCPHLNDTDAYSVSVAIYHLVQDLRKATDATGVGPLALAEISGQLGNIVISENAGWLNGAGKGLTADQVALFILDSRRRSIQVQGVSADEPVMARLVDAVDTVTRASSNLIFAYLQTNDL